MNSYPSSVGAALAACAHDHVVVDDGVNRHRAADICARAESLAYALEQSGAQVVASQLDNGIAWLILDLALAHLGAVHVPLPPFFSATQTAHALARSGADHLLGGVAPGPSWAGGDWAGYGGWRRARSNVALPADCALITFTSGSTGQPKGVCLSRLHLETVASSLVQASAPLSLRTHLCVLPLSTLLEHVAGFYAGILAGARIAVPGLAALGYSGASALDPATLLATLHRFAPESVILVPQLLLALVMAAERGAPLPPSLRMVAVGGARISPDLLVRAARVGLPVYEGYGLSECGSVVCLNRAGASRPGSVGQPLAHARVHRDAHGELHVHGMHMLGYLGEPPLAPGPFATGDLAQIDSDGFVQIVGRKKNLFITAFGRNVSPEWVEAELIQQPAIAQAMVHGEARAFNTAVLVAREPDASDSVLQAAVDAANRELPDYARIGAWLRATVPFSTAQGTLTGNGRLRRDAIAAHYRDAIDAIYTTFSRSNPMEAA